MDEIKLVLNYYWAALKDWWRRNIIAEGWEDEKGFHYGRETKNSEEK